MVAHRRAAAALLQLLLMYIPRVPLCSAPASAPLLPRHIASMPAHPCAHPLRCLPVCARFCAFHPSTSTPTPFDFFFRHPLSPQRGAVQAWLMVLLHSEFTPLSSPTIISTIILSYVAFILTSTHPLLQPRTLLPPNLNIITLLNPPHLRPSKRTRSRPITPPGSRVIAPSSLHDISFDMPNTFSPTFYPFLPAFRPILFHQHILHRFLHPPTP